MARIGRYLCVKTAFVVAAIALIAACAPVSLGPSDPPANAKDNVIASQQAATDAARGGSAGGWEQPWEVTDYCYAVRRGGTFWVWLNFREATADDLGRSYEIELEGNTTLDIPSGYPYDAQIALDWVTYPTNGDDDVKVTVIREVGTGDTVFRIDDPKHVFRDAMFKAGIMTFKFSGSQAIFSMGTSEKLLKELKSCFKLR